MTDIAVQRLRTQRLSGEPFASAVEAVGWLGAVQSQDYAGAKWALAQRTRDVTDADLDRLFDQGAILRTHVLRPTWHFVLPDDIRWMLELTGPRVEARLSQYDRQLEIDPSVRKRSHDVMQAALAGGRYLTRTELAAALERAAIPATGLRLVHLIMHAELDAHITSGPRRKKQMTYALLDERAPSAPEKSRDEALAELTRRYFTSHGPAQVQDFVWWSGLTVADAKRGLALSGPALRQEVVGEKSYWTSSDSTAAEGVARKHVHLLPNYDEFLVAYRDRAAALDPVLGLDTTPFPRGSILSHVVVINGQVRGAWKRRVARSGVIVELALPAILTTTDEAALQQAAQHLGRFLGVPATVSGLD